MSPAGPVVAAALAVGGTLAGQALGSGHGLGPFGAAALAGGVAIRSRRNAWWAVALAFVAAGLMQRALDGLDGPPAQLARAGQDAMAEVRLVDDPGGGQFAVRAVARTRTGSLLLLSASGDAAMRLRLLSAGEGAVVEGTFRPLHEVETRYRWRHVQAALEVHDLLEARPAGGMLFPLANRLRDAVLAGTEPLPAELRGLAAGLLVGDTREIHRRLAEQFRDSGLSHLLAVSGANVALVLALAGPVLRRLRLAGRCAGGLAVIALFAAVTRFEPSVLRASVMAALALLATFAGRPAAGLRILGLTVTVLVLTDPFLVHSVGFRLSCAASAGIIVLGPRLMERLPGPYWARQTVAATVAAQVAVAPIVLPLSGELPLIALPANLLVAPAAAAVTGYGMASGLISAGAGWLSSGWANPLAVPLELLVGYVRVVAAMAAAVRLPVSAGPATLLLPAGLTLAELRFRRWRRSARPPGRAGDPPRHGPGRGTGARGRPPRS